MFKLTTIGSARIKSKFGAAAKKLGNLREENLQAVTLLDGWIKKNFRAEGGLHDNKSLKWRPLSPARKKHKVEAGKDSGILQYNGTLRNQWDLIATRKTGILRSRASHKGVAYGIKHEKGIGVPMRKILPEREQAEKIITPVYRKAMQLFTK